MPQPSALPRCASIRVAVSVFVLFALAAELRARYPGRVLAALLIAVGIAYLIRSLAATTAS